MAKDHDAALAAYASGVNPREPRTPADAVECMVALPRVAIDGAAAAARSSRRGRRAADEAIAAAARAADGRCRAPRPRASSRRGLGVGESGDVYACALVPTPGGLRRS